MAKLTRMIVALIGAALLNKMLKGSYWSAKKPMSNENQSSQFQILQEAVFAFLLSRSKVGWLIQPAAISTATAILTTLMNSMKRDDKSKNHIIEPDGYRVIE